MKLLRSLPYFIAAAAVVITSRPALHAQGYPKVDPAIQQEANAHKAAADKLSDEIFAKAMPEIEAWAAKGKPYIPNAGQKSYEILDTKTVPEIEAWVNREKFNSTGAISEELPQAKIPAFPGAEGGGMYSFGGRGGKVLVVTNLNDSGPGSFREACETAGPRIVIFNVAGIIQLKDRIRVRAPYITIAGNTAPGDGVCIAGNTVELETHDIVIRYMRFRRGALDAADRNDSFGGNPIGNLIIDHVSASWGLDENMSMYRHMYNPKNGGKELKLPTVNVTIQHSIFSEGLNLYHHAFGSTIGGLNSTFHHNIWACNTGRNPSVGMYGDFTFANNVIFNYRHRTIDGGDHRSFYNIINNTFKPGPGTPDEDVAYRLLKPESERSKTAVNNFGKAYVNGNIVVGHERITKDNWDGGVQPAVSTRIEIFEELMKNAPKNNPAKLDEFTAKTMSHVAELKFIAVSNEDALKRIRVNEPFKHAPITLQPAAEAYEFALANAGATLPKRDAVDQRVVQMVRTGVVAKTQIAPGSREKAKAVAYADKWIDEMEVLVTKGYITNPSEVGGYPKYEGTPYKDTDGDGLPDAWETAHGLDPKNATDATTDLNGDGYTNIEEFINGRDPR
jgi:hypothetical protein